MEKKWQVAAKIKGDFIKKYPDYNRVILQLLYNRNLKSKKDIEDFLQADLGDLLDPFLFKDMEKAVRLIIKHIKEQNKIFVYGDFDADGVTSSALLVEVLNILKANVDVHIPDRVNEGYGVNRDAIEDIKNRGGKLIITVDCGIKNKEEVSLIKEKGLDVLITDHHTPPEKKNLPQCLLINPALKEKNYSFYYLAGVGVAFKLAQALISKSSLTAEDKKILQNKILDLVAIGTIADCVSLTGENRILTKAGLKAMNKKQRTGVKSLLKIAGLEGKELKAWNIGFQIAPRLNASGRMGQAAEAFELLLSKDKKNSQAIAENLNNKNARRQQITEDIISEAEEQIKKQEDDKVMVVINHEKDRWSEGVIGLVAGRLTEKYYRPFLVLTKTDECYKGSGRSIEEFNLIKAIDENKQFLDKFGGHPSACGFSLFESNLDYFVKAIKSTALRELKDLDLKPKTDIDMELDLSQINHDLVEQIEVLAPFGQDNPVPVFVSKGARIKDIVLMGNDKKHIKFRLNGFWAVAFSQADKWQDLKIGDTIDIVYTLDLNKFNGNTQVQLKVIDIKKT